MRYPVADTELIERSDEQTEIRARLVGTAAADEDLDIIVAHLSKTHGIDHATWDVQTQD